jgi:hypothetical protein
MTMTNAQVYKVVRQWLHDNVEVNDWALGDVTVVSFAICDIDEDIKRDLAKYNYPEVAEDAKEYKEAGATYMVRFLMVCEADLVDGDDVYFYLEDGKLVRVSEWDAPAFNGGHLDEGMAWVTERALRCATDICNDDE